MPAAAKRVSKCCGRWYKKFHRMLEKHTIVRGGIEERSIKKMNYPERKISCRKVLKSYARIRFGAALVFLSGISRKISGKKVFKDLSSEILHLEVRHL